MCDICMRYPCHPRCPNYEPQKAKYYCSICDEGIYDGEEYIENNNGDYRHYECFDTIRDLVEWLGYEVKMMENDDSYYND